MGRRKMNTSTDQRPFTIIYHDFLENAVLDTDEKMVFIALKKFADEKGQCFPSIARLSEITGMQRRKISYTLRQLESKNIIKTESRYRTDGGMSSNQYTLYDYAEMWRAESREDLSAVVDELEEQRLIDILTEKGYRITKEKELDSSLPAKVKEETSYVNQEKNIQIDNNNDTLKENESQYFERFSLSQIKEIYSYDSMLEEKPLKKETIDAVMSILHTTMNTSKGYIRINGDNKPVMVVIGKLMKLTYSGIIYAIEKFEEQTDRIKNTTAYMLTLLYNAEEQMHLDITNRVSHDMNRWDNE